MHNFYHDYQSEVDGKTVFTIGVEAIRFWGGRTTLRRGDLRCMYEINKVSRVKYWGALAFPASSPIPDDIFSGACRFYILQVSACMCIHSQLCQYINASFLEATLNTIILFPAAYKALLLEGDF